MPRVHTAAVVGKQLTQAFYGTPFTKAYHASCSTGGRQAMKAAQEFPDDFDGIVAGAPAFAFSNLTSYGGWQWTAGGSPSSPQYVKSSMWGMIHKEVIRQCDHLDGYKDGIIEDFEQCQFDINPLLCKSLNTKVGTCLNQAQAAFVRAFYRPLLQRDGSIIFPGTPIGTEPTFISGYGTPLQITVDWYQNVVFENLKWNLSSLSLEDMAHAWKLNPQNINTWNGDLTKFKARGGKLIHYHGTADNVIPATISAKYYNYVMETMKATPNDLDTFYRYFPIPAMEHCMGGIGAWDFGQSGFTPSRMNPNENILLSIIEWVEQGRAPEKLIGTAYNKTMSSFKRGHCRYPKTNKFKETGNPKDPQNWECVEKNKRA